MAKEEYLLKLVALEQEINKLEQQMQLIEQQVLEIYTIQICLQELKKSKEKQMFANLGKNIFIKTEIQDKNLFMDVGNRIFVKKNISDTLKIVEDQLIRLGEAKSNVLGKMQEIQQQMEQIVVEAEKAERK